MQTNPAFSVGPIETARHGTDRSALTSLGACTLPFRQLNAIHPGMGRTSDQTDFDRLELARLVIE